MTLSKISLHITVTLPSTTNYSFHRSESKVTFESSAFYLLTEVLV